MPDQDPAQPGAPLPELHGLDPGELLARALNSPKPSAGASRWIPPTAEELSALLPQYRIESILGHGGMGAVYKGRQATLDRPVAIKLLPAELAANGDFVARFQREARTLARLQHNGIVAVYDFGQTSAGHLYFVMEYVDGTDLHHVLKGPGLQPEQAFELIAQICEALHYAHRQGVIHRDIKPANILLTKDGRAKVADFGLARPLTEDSGVLTVTNVVMGTPAYMAPEQRFDAAHADHRADIFALGVMLYEMLTGQRPHGAFEPPSHRVRVDVRIDEVVLKALQQDPDRRYQQASEMKTDVDGIRSTPMQAPSQVGKKRRTPFPLAGIAMTAAVALVGGMAWWKMQEKSGPPALPEAGDSSVRHESLTPEGLNLGNTPVGAQSAPRQSSAPASVSPLWKKVPFTAEESAEAAANDGWLKRERFYPTLTAQQKFKDGAVRLRYRWAKGGQIGLSTRKQGGTNPSRYVDVRLRDGGISLYEWASALSVVS